MRCERELFKMRKKYVSVTTTADSLEAIERIALAVLHPRLAACAQVEGPLESRYWWQGELATSREWRCTMKAPAANYAALEAAIRTVHPYKTPEIIASAVLSGGRDYLAWIDEVSTTP
jgi:periplasmic divalent cation tolerance protein